MNSNTISRRHGEHGGHRGIKNLNLRVLRVLCASVRCILEFEVKNDI